VICEGGEFIEVDAASDYRWVPKLPRIPPHYSVDDDTSTAIVQATAPTP
jgi:hypothetical protein